MVPILNLYVTNCRVVQTWKHWKNAEGTFDLYMNKVILRYIYTLYKIFHLCRGNPILSGTHCPVMTLGEMSRTQCPIISLTYWLGERWVGLSANWFPWHTKFGRYEPDSVPNNFPDMLSLGQMSQTQCPVISLTCWLWGGWARLSAQ